MSDPFSAPTAPALVPMASLTSRERRAIVLLAVHRGVPGAYIASRLDRYPLVARAFDARGLAAFQLVEPFDRGPRRRLLVYLGPLVSRDGAYLGLFGAMVDALLAAGRPFWCAAEVETPLVIESLAHLLPTRAWPSPRSALTRPRVRAVLADFARTVPHMEGYDPVRLTSAVTCPIARASASAPAPAPASASALAAASASAPASASASASALAAASASAPASATASAPAAAPAPATASAPAPESARYRLALFGWDGSAQDRAGLLAELDRGYATLARTPCRRSA